MKKILLCIATLIISAFNLYGMEQKDVSRAFADALLVGINGIDDKEGFDKAVALLRDPNNKINLLTPPTIGNDNIWEMLLKSNRPGLIALAVTRFGDQLTDEELDEIKDYPASNVQSAVLKLLNERKKTGEEAVNEKVAGLLGGNRVAQLEAAQLITTGIVDPNYKYKNTTIFDSALTDNPIIMTALILKSLEPNRVRLNQQQIDKVKNTTTYSSSSSLQKAVAEWEKQNGKKIETGDQTDELLRLVQSGKDNEAKTILRDSKSKINFGEQNLLPLIASTGDFELLQLFLQKGKGQIPAAIIERALSYSKNNKPIIDALNAALGKPAKETPGELTFQQVIDKMSEALDNKNIIGALNRFKTFNAASVKEPIYAPVWSGAAFAASQLDPNDPNVLGTQKEQVELVGLLIDAAGKNFNEKLIDQQHGATIIHWAVAKANFPLLQTIISKLSDLISPIRMNVLVNKQDNAGATPLLIAASSYETAPSKKLDSVYENIYEFLVRNGAQDLALKTPDGKLLEKPSEVMERARVEKSKPQKKDATDQLVDAIDNREIGKAEAIFTMKPIIDFKRPIKGSANILQYAIASGDEMMVKLLIKFGAPIGDAELLVARKANNDAIYKYIEQMLEEKKPVVINNLEQALRVLGQRLTNLARVI
ncbi:ankyrin repeat domain-containing protein [Candidatus Dependentiae bacterium]|nr:ankyrin repeat domain-containing protein [Candidatus Dependentiae bacterium]